MLGDKFLERTAADLDSGMEPKEIFLHWNLARTRYVAGLYLFMQFLNLIDGGVFVDFGMGVSCILTTALNVSYLLFSFLAEKRNFSLNTIRYSQLAYWVLLAPVCAFFFVYDISLGGLPANLLIVYLFLATVPVFNAEETILVFSVPYLFNIALGIAFGAGLAYYGYGLMFAICGLVVSLITGRQYVLLISRLREVGSYDQLTGLLMRHMGIARAEVLIASCKRTDDKVCAFMTDIDLFKKYNDAFGHVEGDEVLKRVALAVKSEFKRSDDVLMRFGGEEYLAFARVDSPEAALALAERICNAVRSLNIPAPEGSVAPYVTLSVGAFIGNIDSDKDVSTVYDKWLEKADAALYEAKEQGRNRVVLAEG